MQNSWQDTEDQAKAEKKFLELLQNRDKNNSEISAEPENANDNSAKEIQKHLNSYLLAVKNTGCSAATIRNYKSDIKQFLDFLGENNLEALGSKPKLLAFAKYQREKGLKDSSIKRKIVSIGQFKNWLKDEGLLKSEIPLSTKQVKNAPSQDLQAIDSRIALEQELKAQQLVAQQLLAQQTQTHGGEDSTKLAQETKKRRSWFGQSKRGVGQAQHRPNKLALILNIIALLFFIGGLGYLAYQQFGQAVLSLAYPSLPTSPNRILSFQGRLTNTARTPIATQTDMVYKLYDNVTGGNLLWSSNTCTITPDQDGIFNTNLGAGAGDGSDDEDCGATIDDSVFTENSNVWLEVTVGNAPSSETLTPRQPIRTVAYAINAETVQGIRPSLIATHSTLLMLNDQGQLVLGTDSPEVKTATGSSLMVEADSIMIQTQAGSNGDIILAPDGIGNVGIGTTDPSEKLDVDGKIRIRTIDNAVGDILTTSATGIIQKRTAEELRGDIGAGREINSVYYVEGNTSGTAGTWTGNHDDVITYYDGLKVAYKIGIAGASTTRLNINNLGAVLVRRNNANLTTHLPVGTVVVLTYTTIAGTPYWVWADYDSNTTESYTVRWNNTLQAGAQITKYKIIMAGTDNKWYPLTVGDTTAATKTVASTEFLINSPILAYYTTPTIAPNATFTNIWEGINMAYLDYTLNKSTGMTAYAPVYLVGTINANGNFVLDGAGTANNNFWTQTLPTTEDGKVYIMIGIMHNTTTTMRLMVNKPMYEFKDGKIREYSDPDLSEYVPYSGATQDLDLGNNNLYVGGDVGIGTISPSYKLDVAGDINFTGALRANGSAGTIGQILLSQGANNPVWSDVSGAISDYAWLQGGNSFGSIGVLGTNDAYDLQLETGGATQMTIDTTGNVGIGTTDPAGKLHLNLGVGNINSSVYIDQTSSTGYSSITMRDERVSNSYVGQWGLYGSGVSAPNTSNMFFYNTAGGGIGFYVGSGGSPTNDLRMFIANSGNVGIGTTSPSYLLDVAGDI
ncbi:MAG TPA: site-specific integrase, partial [Candidatus Woesebacteria bacterium]|nr:site-specific integrase [Candidatus Woesebacteria bacterium]